MFIYAMNGFSKNHFDLPDYLSIQGYSTDEGQRYILRKKELDKIFCLFGDGNFLTEEQVRQKILIYRRKEKLLTISKL